MNLKISYKKGSICALTLLILVSIGMIYFTKDIKTQFGSGSRFINGPKFYPILLAVLMIIFCVISILDTLKKPDKIMEFPNAQKAITTGVVTFVWVSLWQYIGYFYLISFFSMAILLIYLNPAPFSLKKIRNSLLWDISIIGAIYLIFAIALKTRF